MSRTGFPRAFLPAFFPMLLCLARHNFGFPAPIIPLFTHGALQELPRRSSLGVSSLYSEHSEYELHCNQTAE